MKKLLLSALFISFAFTASAQYTEGYLIVNEGSFGTDNANISFLKDGVVTNNIFSAANGGADLGDTAQSMKLNEGKAYIVLNGSNKLVVVDAVTFVETASIETGLTNPRDIAFYGDNAYITCWGNAGVATDDYLAVINLSDNTIATTIALAEGVEKIITVGDKLYVAHQGGYGQGTTVSVVNPVTNAFETAITVGDVPNALVENNGSLYVLCSGNPTWAGTETGGSLVKINLADNTVTETINFAVDAHPSHLTVYGTDFYYTVDEFIFKKEVAAATLPETSLFSIEPQGAYGIYGFNIVDDKIYVGDDGDFIAAASVHVYDINGVFGQTYGVGFMPNSIQKSAAAVAGNDKFDALTVSVYPNPVAEVLYVNTTEAAAVRLFDVTGRTVISQAYNEEGVNVSALPAGTYFAEITVGAAKTVKQIVVQ